jgi:hypothetical protein
MYLRGPKVTGAVLTPLAAGLLESETGRTTWGVIPGDKPGEPSSDDGLENHFPSTIVFVDVGSRESSLVEETGLEPATCWLQTNCSSS